MTTRNAYTFKVRQAAGAPLHSITIKIPASAADLTAKQQATVYENAIDGIVIKVQGTLRRALGKGVRGESLNAVAQNAFDAILNAVARNLFQVQKTIVDLRGKKGWTQEQIQLLRDTGAEVLTDPEEAPEEAAPEGEEQEEEETEETEEEEQE